MSAIAGIWSDRGSRETRAACIRMLKAQAIYGPHGEAVWDGGSLSLGKRLFRTVPEDRQDRGPLSIEDGPFAIVADVRLDNRKELADDLGLRPEDWQPLSDTALLLRTLIRWEEDAVGRLEGDFAFAFWDGPRNRLLLARDFLGQRPLHYHRSDGFVAFASMPKGLHALPDIPRAPRLEAVADFLALSPESGSGTFFEGVEKVEPGHVVCIDRGRAVARRYWQPDLTPLRLRTPQDYEEGLRAHLDRAVSSRLRGADGRIGSHLSAGLDSSAIAATAARLMAAEGGRVTAFTAVPQDGYRGSAPGGAIADEWPLAAATAALHSNIDHVPVSAAGRSPFDALDRHFFLADRPVLNLVNFPWWDAINDAARDRQLPILLTGVMGNMSFSHGGMELLPQLLKRGRLLRLARIASRLSRNGVRWGTIGAQTLGPFLPAPVWSAIGRMRGAGWDIDRYSALRSEQLDRLGVRTRAAERGLDFSYRPMADGVAMRLWVLGRADPGNYNKAMLGGWGIDCRDPSADRRLVEFCLRVPAEEYLRDGVLRGLARRALSDRLPSAVLNETRKGYQAADWHEVLAAHRDELSDQISRVGAFPPAADLIDVDGMQRLVDDWPTGGWNSHHVVQRYRLALLRGVTAGHFVRKASGSNA